MFSYNEACHKNDVREGRFFESGRRVMVAHNTKLNKYCALRGASAMTVGLSKFGSISGMKYGEPLDDPVCVCGFEKALSAGQLIYFGDLVRPVMD